MSKDRLIPIAIVAHQFSVNRRTITNWIEQGKVFKAEGIKRLPGGIRILSSEVDRAISELPDYDE